MPEMVAAVAVVIDRLPDWLWPLSIRASVHFHVICSYRQGESLAFRKQTAPYRPESMSQTLNAGSYLPNLLGIIGQPHSSTSSSMALIGRGRLRLLPLAATVQPKVSSPRKQETPVCTVLHFVSVLRMHRFKPLPEISHRGRE